MSRYPTHHVDIDGLVSWRQAALELAAVGLRLAEWPTPFERTQLGEPPLRMRRSVLSTTISQRSARWHVPILLDRRFGTAASPPNENDVESPIVHATRPCVLPPLDNTEMHWVLSGRPMITDVWYAREEVNQFTREWQSPALTPLQHSLRPTEHAGGEQFVGAADAAVHLKRQRVRPDTWPTLYWRPLGTAWPLKEAPHGEPLAGISLLMRWLSQLFFKGTLSYPDPWLPLSPQMSVEVPWIATGAIELYMLHSEVMALLTVPAAQEPAASSPNAVLKASLLRTLEPGVRSGEIDSLRNLRSAMRAQLIQDGHTDSTPNRSSISRWARELWLQIHPKEDI